MNTTQTKLNMTEKQLEKHLKRLQNKKINTQITQNAFTKDNITVATNSHLALRINQKLENDLTAATNECFEKINCFFEINNSFYAVDLNDNSNHKVYLTINERKELIKVLKLIHSLQDRAILTLGHKGLSVENSKANDTNYHVEYRVGIHEMMNRVTKDTHIQYTVNAQYLANMLEFSNDNKDDFTTLVLNEQENKPFLVLNETENNYLFLGLPFRANQNK